MRSSSRSDVDPFIVMDVMEAARKAEVAGQHVIHMEVGQPGTPAPRGALEALSGVLHGEPLGYTVALGLPELRTRIAKLYRDWYGVELSAERVIVTSGSSAAFLLAFTALFDAGDRVGVAEPGYPSYRQILKALSLEPVGMPTRQENGHHLGAEDILSANVKGAIVASPNNPTGTMLDRTRLWALVHACTASGKSFISDEIYHGLHYGERAVSALEISDDVYVINSFSKYFSMTGWRIGWMVVPEDHIRTIERLAQNMFICPPHASQVAAIGAFDCIDELEANRNVYARNRQVLTRGLKEIGLARFAPADGAFYVYVDISETGTDSLSLSRELLDRAGVAVTPGLDFDPVRGADTLRFSYARSHEDILEGVRRLKAFFS